jgi:hypothetical protein
VTGCGGMTRHSTGSGGTASVEAGGGTTNVEAGEPGSDAACTPINSDIAPPCTSDANCTVAGTHCTAVVPGGYKTCLENEKVATSCTEGNDACGCDGGACGAGTACYLEWGTADCASPNACLSPCTPGSCDAGEACVAAVRDWGDLGNPIPQCATATCRTDSDCGGCSRCAPCWSYGADCNNGFFGLRCTCRTDRDCKPGFKCYNECADPPCWDGGTHYCLAHPFF